MTGEGPESLAEGLTTFVFLVLFLSGMGTMVYRMWLRHVIHHTHARHMFPKLAEELHLRHKPSRDPKGIGSLRGTFRGYRVVLDADAHESSPKLNVRLRKRHSLDLVRESWGELEGTAPITFPVGKLNRYFKTRRAAPELAAWLTAGCPADERVDQERGAGYRRAGAAAERGPDVVATLDDFVSRWGKKLVVFKLQREELGCSLALGSGENTVQSLSPEQVRALLPDMIALAEALDAMPEPFAREPEDD